MREQPQPHAVLPGMDVHACQVHSHVVVVHGEPLQIHVTRYPFASRPSMWPGGPTGRLQRLFDDLELHALAVEPLDRMQETPALGSADVILSGPGDLPALLMLDRLCRRRRAARVIAVVTDQRSAVVWVRTSGDILGPDTGYTMTVTCDEPGPVELYGSALYGWVQWWVKTVMELRGGGADGQQSPVQLRELPPPPDELDIVEAWRPYRAHITDIHRETRHRIPERPRQYWTEPGPE
ncbi:hypothetical protein AB0F11_14090 [Streptomyces sp. NPDC032472]|uniref:hypothetical protein n=1 Tax=Streptomyces sp. NPDC032472 TaxID=3155018 RepID=UPI0033CBB71C